MANWAIKDNNGQLLDHYLGSSRIELGCKVMPARYDVFRLHVSASYRELFERALQQALQAGAERGICSGRRQWPAGICAGNSTRSC